MSRVEEARKESGQSRSELVREAVEAHLRQKREAADAEAYRRGYELFPETEEEIEALDRMGAAVLAALPWDETG